MAVDVYALSLCRCQREIGRTKQSQQHIGCGLVCVAVHGRRVNEFVVVICAEAVVIARRIDCFDNSLKCDQYLEMMLVTWRLLRSVYLLPLRKPGLRGGSGRPVSSTS